MTDMPMSWTVDYGNGARPVQIPHVWHGEMPVSWEGPAIYRTKLLVDAESQHLLFHGVSYLAEVFVNGEPVIAHKGIWDAFSVDLAKWKEEQVDVEVRVTKNGGSRFPVKQVASGFIPYVYHTFGGIFRPVELLGQAPDLTPVAPQPRVRIQEGRVIADGQLFYARGILTWGWNPRTSNPHSALPDIKAELDQIEAMGFNLVKFCLWLPSHEYIEELARRGMWAWIELPIWLPATDQDSLNQMAEESLRIVAQYRGHSNILAWTAGCELSEGIDPKWRKQLVESIQELTGHPLVKDNSGGAEMYGGHPAEFGTFEDFHPYCDPMFYSGVFHNLARGPRVATPTFLGEFNDYDVFRPVHRMVDDVPFWASENEDLNAQGVRSQYDLPNVRKQCQESDLGEWLVEREEVLLASSLKQGAWMRERAFDATRLQVDIDGWVLTGHRHTPISTSGVIGDLAEYVYPLEVVRAWTSDTALMLFPRRTPPWVDGGNRAGWEPTAVRFAGDCLFQVAALCVTAESGSLAWSLSSGESGTCPVVAISPLEPTEIGHFVVNLSPGIYELKLAWTSTHRTFKIRVVERLKIFESPEIIQPEQTLPRPFFREACYSYEHPAWQELDWIDDFDRLSLVATDRAICPKWLDEVHPGWKPLLVRLDTRNFERLPIVALCGTQIITTLRPNGGLGDQPIGIERNPGGHDLIRLFNRMLQSA